MSNVRPLLLRDWQDVLRSICEGRLGLVGYSVSDGKLSAGCIASMTWACDLFLGV